MIRQACQILGKALVRRETACLLNKLHKQRVNEYVFENPKSFYWSCSKWVGKLVGLAKIEYCTLLDIRKTCNTLMKDAGVSLEAAMQVLGHASLTVSQRGARLA